MDARKKQILQNMGITVWQTRPLVSDLNRPSVVVEPVAEPERRPAKPPESSEAQSRAAPKPLPAADPVQPSAAEKPKVATAQDAVDEALSFVCLTAGNVVFALVPPAGEREQRFAGDIVRAAAGKSLDRITQIRFDWPQRAGGTLISGNRNRAIQAFIDKQRQNSNASVVLITDDLLETMQSLDGDIINLPPLKALAADGGAKKRLWQQIQKIR